MTSDVRGGDLLSALLEEEQMQGVIDALLQAQLAHHLVDSANASARNRSSRVRQFIANPVTLKCRATLVDPNGRLLSLLDLPPLSRQLSAYAPVHPKPPSRARRGAGTCVRKVAFGYFYAFDL